MPGHIPHGGFPRPPWRFARPGANEGRRTMAVPRANHGYFGQQEGPSGARFPREQGPAPSSREGPCSGGWSLRSKGMRMRRWRRLTSPSRPTTFHFSRPCVVSTSARPWHCKTHRRCSSWAMRWGCSGTRRRGADGGMYNPSDGWPLRTPTEDNPERPFYGLRASGRFSFFVRIPRETRHQSLLTTCLFRGPRALQVASDIRSADWMCLGNVGVVLLSRGSSPAGCAKHSFCSFLLWECGAAVQMPTRGSTAGPCPTTGTPPRAQRTSSLLSETRVPGRRPTPLICTAGPLNTSRSHGPWRTDFP